MYNKHHAIYDLRCLFLILLLLLLLLLLHHHHHHHRNGINKIKTIYILSLFKLCNILAIFFAAFLRFVRMAVKPKYVGS